MALENPGSVGGFLMNPEVDAELANEVKRAAEYLNAAIISANEAGLQIVVDTHQHTRFGKADRSLVRVAVSRPL